MKEDVVYMDTCARNITGYMLNEISALIFKTSVMFVFVYMFKVGLWCWEPLLSLILASWIFRALIKNYWAQGEQNGRPVAQWIVMNPSYSPNFSHACVIFTGVFFFFISLRQWEQEARRSSATEQHQFVHSISFFKHPDVCVCVLL